MTSLSWGKNPNMLAVDVITDKLRSQHIDEQKHPQPTSHIKLIQPGDGYRLSKNAEATIAGSGKKVWTVPVNLSAAKDILSANNLSQRISDPQKLPAGFTTDLGISSNTPPAPPKKRHCRSLTVGALERPTPAPTQWQPQQSQVWKPICVSSPGESQCTGSLSSGLHTGVYGSDSNVNRTCGELCECSRRTPNFDQGFIIPADIFTPPESPVPRPSSTATCSGRHDGTFSPLGAPWLEHCNRRYDAFQHRSLSLEDRISCSTNTGSMPSVPGCAGSHRSSPYHHSHHHHHHSHYHHIPRCRSQPSMIHDRKGGLKRRRDYDHRPALSFRKMTETAYHNRPEPVSRTGVKEKRVSKFHEELESVMSLMPIASSPMDHELPIKRMMDTRTSPISEMDSCRSDSAEFLDSEASDCIGEGPVKLLGADCVECDDSSPENEEVEEIFQLQEELDLEQIENH